MNTGPVACQPVALAVAALMLCSMPSCNKAADLEPPYDIESIEPEERALVALPLEFDVLPHSRLFVYGERIFPLSSL